jgi:hypothetical protein
MGVDLVQLLCWLITWRDTHRGDEISGARENNVMRGIVWSSEIFQILSLNLFYWWLRAYCVVTRLLMLFM